MKSFPKDSRLVYLLPIVVAVALLVATLVVYAGLLTDAWGSLLACTPAVLVTIAVVSGIAGGVILFSQEEQETAREAARPDGAILMDRFGQRLAEMIHRVTSHLHQHA